MFQIKKTFVAHSNYNKKQFCHMILNPKSLFRQLYRLLYKVIYTYVKECHSTFEQKYVYVCVYKSI